MERKRLSKDNQAAFLAEWFVLLGSVCWMELGFEINQEVGTGQLGEEGLWDPQEILAKSE